MTTSWINDGKTISAQVDPAHPSYIAPVCFLDDEWSPEIVAANARLISAAPDLFKALKALVSTARTFRDVPKDEQEWTSIDDDALEAAFDAIAKATGEQA